MAAQGVDPDRNVLHACLSEFLRSLVDTLAVGAHGIVAAGNEEHGKALVHGCQVLLLLNEINALHHVPQQTCAGGKAAEGVGNVFVEDVLDAPYFHVVFTVPQELNPLIYSNQQLLYDALYHCVSATINELTADTKHLGAKVGYICVLHTWGSEMNYHPHIHIILLGGGLTAKNQWRDKGEEFFLPVKVMSKLFRGKYMAELKTLWEEEKLQFHGSSEKYRNHYAFKELLNICYEKDWIPHCKKTFNGAQSVINYLGKYTHRIAISNHRIIRMDEDTVTFYVKDYREEGRWKEHTVSGIEFIRRFLMHVPPKRFVRIRHYGLLCTRTKTRQLTLCRNLLGCKQYLSKLKGMETPQILETLYGIKVTVCKCCGGHLGKPQQRIPLRI